MKDMKMYDTVPIVIKLKGFGAGTPGTFLATYCMAVYSVKSSLFGVILTAISGLHLTTTLFVHTSDCHRICPF
jgi:hypothetical protein